MLSLIISCTLNLSLMHSQKLTERKASLEKMAFSKQEDKTLWEKILVVEMMSSEDSEVDEEEEVLAVHPLPWRASKVDVMLKRLDDDMKETKSLQARRQMKKRCVGHDSIRSPPIAAKVSSVLATELDGEQVPMSMISYTITILY